MNKNYLIFLLTLLGYNHMAYSQGGTLSQVKYCGRWVDKANEKFYDHEFYIPIKIHQNVSYQNDAFVEQIYKAVEKWNNITDTYFRMSISSTYSTNSQIYDGLDYENVLGFSSTIFSSETDPPARTQPYFVASHLDGVNFKFVCGGGWDEPRQVQVDIAFNPFKKFDVITTTSTDVSDTRVDFRGAVMHELGHLAGIDHLNNSEGNLMHKNMIEGEPAKNFSDLDIFAIRRLYGPKQGNEDYDHDQHSSIPCSYFLYKPGGQFVVANPNSSNTSDPNCTCKNNGKCCRKNRLASDPMDLSLAALHNIALYSINNLGTNINYIRRTFGDNEGEIMEMVSGTDEKYAGVRHAMNYFMSVNGQLIENAFVNDDETKLENYNLYALDSVIKAISKVTTSDKVRKECTNIRKGISLLKGKPIKEALVTYDNADLTHVPIYFDTYLSGLPISVKILNNIGRNPVLSYRLYKPGHIVFGIYDISGKLVTSIDLGNREEGFYEYPIYADDYKGIHFVTVSFDGKIAKDQLTKFIASQ